jgi:O-acetylserine/cysteine efflux transporter
MAAFMSQTTQHRFGSLDMLVVIVMNLMWGLNLIAVKMAVDLVQPMTAAFLRQFIVLIVCLPALKIIPGKMRPLLLLGFLSGALFYIVNNIAFEASTNIGALAIVGQLSVPFSLILAVVYLREKIRIYRIIGVTLSFIGVVILVFDPAIAQERFGAALMVVVAMIWAVCTMVQRHLVGAPIFTIYAWVGAVGTITILPIAAIAEPEAFRAIPDISLAAFGWIAFSAIGSTVVGQGAMSWLIQRHEVSTVIPLTLATPIISVIASWAYFDTPFTPLMAFGGTVALTGIAVIAIRTARAGRTL